MITKLKRIKINKRFLNYMLLLRGRAEKKVTLKVKQKDGHL